MSSYKEGIIKAIKELNDGDGSTVVSIQKFMQQNDLPKEQPTTSTWNDRVFRLSIESLVLVGDLDQELKKTATYYKLSDKYIQKCQANSMFSNDLKSGHDVLMHAGAMRSAMFHRLKRDLDNADRFPREYLKEQGLTPDVVAKLREVQGRSQEEKELDIEALKVGLKTLLERIISIPAPHVPTSMWTVMCQGGENYTPTHMNEATIEAVFEQSNYDLHPEQMMLPVSNVYLLSFSTPPNLFSPFLHCFFFCFTPTKSLETCLSKSIRRSSSDSTCAFMTSPR
jgi:hypothetical protein